MDYESHQKNDRTENVKLNFNVSENPGDWADQLYQFEINKIDAESRGEPIDFGLQSALLELYLKIPDHEDIVKRAERDYVEQGYGFKVSDDPGEWHKQLVNLEINRIHEVWEGRGLSPYLESCLKKLCDLLPDKGRAALQEAGEVHQENILEEQRLKRMREVDELRRQAEMNAARGWFRQQANGGNTNSGNFNQGNNGQRANYEQNKEPFGPTDEERAREIALYNLGVTGEESREEISRAYRRFVKKNHPDATIGLDAAERKRREALFKSVSEGYNLL